MSVAFKEHAHVGEIRLLAPRTLNVLTLEMIQKIKNQLELWKSNPEIKCVFIHSEGDRAFSAGGDVKSLYFLIKQARENNQDAGEVVNEFFETEYDLDLLLHTYPKPVVAWGHGFIMGGGLGMFLACSHSIVTETSMLSMPEINIGFFPDVGASYFLNKLPNNLGYYLALTAHRLNAKESLDLGMSSYYLPHNKKEICFQQILQIENQEELKKKLEELQEKPMQESWLKKNMQAIEQVVGSKDIQSIYKKFQESNLEDKVWMKNRQTFLQGSPTSASIICEQLKRGKGMTLKQVFEMELKLARNLARNQDFPEGVRALLVDKKDKPTWQPSTIPEVSSASLQKYFL